MAKSFSDGASNTIAFGEHYAYKCGDAEFNWFTDEQHVFDKEPRVMHRASFADADSQDVIPITSGAPPVTVGSVPNVTFQTAPPIADCDPRLPQTPHHAGMLVGLGDGSVRTLSPAMSITTFWAAVTPAGGEVLGNDW
jgi:hypothetical protein